ncbi:MAG: glycosyltransferase family 2 protein [Halioglobus sp.]|nr:glycosyltransferase family 2 protein [Halioglobus sp.]
MTSSQSPPPSIANTAALIVSYYPDHDFQQQLAALTAQFAAVFWVDNTADTAADPILNIDTALHYLPQNSNIGLAAALNVGGEAALRAGFDWVITFDQDSDPVADFLEQHIACWNQSELQPFILGCNYFDVADRASPRFRKGGYVRECTTVITSGCLMFLPHWREMGMFCDGYFIDGVDHEICLRARSRGLVVARHGWVLMQHRIGEKTAGFRFFPYAHPALRKYYSTRNGVCNIRRYSSTDPLWVLRKCLSLCWELIILLLLESDKGLKIKAMRRGFADALKGKAGRAPDDFSA